MKKIYEKPVLTVEEFDLEDIITESGARLGDDHTRTNNWETENLDLFG